MKIAWLFPGQGSQSVGMGRALYESSAAARAVFERADRALGWSISKICFEGPESELTLTEYTQPALVTTSIAALAAVRERLPDLPAPTFAAGHSLGEYSALVAAGALDLEDAVRTVHVRGAAMQRAVPTGQGKMAAIMGGEPAEVEALCREAAQGEVVSPANFNAPGQVVIAGHATAVDRAVDLAKGKGLKAIVLKVSAPFHCSLMTPAATEVKQALSGVSIRAPQFAVVANVDAEPNVSAERVADLLVRQVASPVLWDRTLRHMADAGVERALEIGPGKVLAGLAKRVDKRVQVASIGEPDDIEKIAAFLAG